MPRAYDNHVADSSAAAALSEIERSSALSRAIVHVLPPRKLVNMAVLAGEDEPRGKHSVAAQRILLAGRVGAAVLLMLLVPPIHVVAQPPTRVADHESGEEYRGYYVPPVGPPFAIGDLVKLINTERTLQSRLIDK